MVTLVAWVAGLAFVLSLACFGYTYAVTLAVPAAGRASAGAAVAAVATDVVLFAAFALHHSLLARPAAKRLVWRFVPHRLERTFFVLVASFLLMLVCVAWRPLPGVLYDQAGLARWLHLAIVAAGVALVVLAAARLDPLELSGIRRATARRARRDAGELVTAFPYNLVRHPIYLGWVLMVFGVPRFTWSRLLMATLSTAYLFVAVAWEERLLVRELGEAYVQYRRGVRWRILPGIY